MTNKAVIIFFLLVLVFPSCKQTTNNTNSKTDKSVMKQRFPEWVKNATIYEVNTRQYTDEGNFKSFEKHLPRLKAMGVDIVWLMPIFPIGEINRKGSLGSYYSVKDYLNVNPDLGTMDDFKSLVNEIHKSGMYVILDWVANHTSWDNKLLLEHPEWYSKDSTGNIISPVKDWADVADLNYDNHELWEYMTDALKFWISECDIDGYRCDVAGMVPVEFWNYARPKLDSIKPVFMLAEWEDPKYLEYAFDMDYAWDLHHIMNDIAQSKKSVKDLDEYFTSPPKMYPKSAIKMNFISNHDENSWNGTVTERMGDAAKAMAVLSATVPGMPLIYSGQEAELNKRLRFFDKDTIIWKHTATEELYSKLFHLKKRNKALWNGIYGADLHRISTSDDDAVFAFIRERDGDKVFVVINLSNETKQFTFNEKCYCDKYTDIFSGKSFEILNEIGMELGPWEYSICEKE